MSEFVLELPPFVVSPSEDESVDSLGEVIDHSQAAVNRLPQQFRGKPNVEALIRALCGPMRQLEQAFVDILLSHHLPNAVGDQLRHLAKIVGQEVLEGLSDDDLRRYVQARIYANRSSGTGPQVLQIVKLVLNSPSTRIHVKTIGNAVARVRLENNPTNFDIGVILYRDFLAPAAGVGIRIILEWWPFDETEMFEFETFIPGEGVGLGWGDVDDEDVGGVLASARGD